MPELRRMFELGQWQIPQPQRPRTATSPSSKCTPCATQERDVRPPNSSASWTGRLPYLLKMESISALVSPRWKWNRKLFLAASSADFCISAGVTVRNELGATKICRNEPGEGS